MRKYWAVDNIIFLLHLILICKCLMSCDHKQMRVSQERCTVHGLWPGDHQYREIRQAKKNSRYNILRNAVAELLSVSLLQNTLVWYNYHLTFEWESYWNINLGSTWTIRHPRHWILYFFLYFVSLVLSGRGKSTFLF